MRIIVVGNGLAGVMAAKTLRELSKDVEIDVFAMERYHYYPRPNLIGFLAGSIPLERVFAFPKDWYRSQRIEVHLETPVTRIFPRSQEAEIEAKEREKYDAILLATGSFPFVPPFKGADKKGVFTLRTLDDVYEILEFLKEHRKVVLIGGGLLGLEIARAVRNRNAEVEVVEFFDRLLPRQLDEEAASLLKAQIEKMGIQVRLGVATEEIIGKDNVEGLRFKGGGETKAQMAIVAAGVRAEIGIAKEAGLETDRGVVVDGFLQTSDPHIFAAGDNIQLEGKTWGIIPASFDQARMAASNILGEKKKYKGTVPSNTLKVVGVDVASIGQVNPEGEGFEQIRKQKKEEGIYKKIVLQNGTIVGAIWMGTKKGVEKVSRLISHKVKVSKWKQSLLEDDFDFSVIEKN
jgi:nitrite reductase (NADH) large subunit